MAFDAEAYLRYFKFKRIKRRGDNIMASCPDFKGIHPRGDQRPSFGIHTISGLSNCFACDTHLNLEQLTAKLLTRELEEPVNEYQAWLWLERRGWLPNEVTPGEIIKQLEKMGNPEGLLVPLEESVLDQYTKGVHHSILDRRISIDAAQEWELRHDPKTMRTIIPVRNRMGLLVGMISRAIQPFDPIRYAVGVPQPGDMHVEYAFKKRLVLYGEHKLRKKDTLLVIESPLDVVYAWSWGVQEEMDIVALFGAMASPVHLTTILSYPRVILALDNDVAGQEGTNSLITSLQGKTRVFLFDNCGEKDLGDMMPDQLKQINKKAKSLELGMVNIPLKLN